LFAEYNPRQNFLLIRFGLLEKALRLSKCLGGDVEVNMMQPQTEHYYQTK